MSKRVGRFTIEHWRDGELLETVKLTEKLVERSEDGTCRVTFPPGRILLNTGDELHFDSDGLLAWLTEVRSCQKK